METTKKRSALLGRVGLAVAFVMALGAGAAMQVATDAQPAYAAQTGWQQTDGKWWYVDESGAYVKGEEKKISGKWYRFDDKGWMVTGWWSGDNEIDTSGTLEKGWKYYNKSGDMAVKCWKKLDGKWYFFDWDGWMLHSGWNILFGTTDAYCFDKSGAWLTNCWVRNRINDDFWSYVDNSGNAVLGWKKINGSWYRFRAGNEEGGAQPGASALVGWWKVDGTWYYFKNSCAMATGWQKIGGSWYYLKSSGAMAAGWQKIGGTWYYLQSSGAMATGWQQIGDSWYYLNSSGAMQSNKWIGNYYVTSSGAMATNTWIGKYHVNENGLWDKTR